MGSTPKIGPIGLIFKLDLLVVPILVQIAQVLRYEKCLQTDRQTDRQTDMSRSSSLSMLIMPIYTLWGLSRFLLYVTHNRTNAIYPGRQGRPGIKML